MNPIIVKSIALVVLVAAASLALLFIALWWTYQVRGESHRR